MKLEHRNTTDKALQLSKRPPVIVKCVNGGHMAKVMHEVRRICTNDLKDKDDLVAWDSQHHEILLWFENEKYESIFVLKGVI